MTCPPLGEVTEVTKVVVAISNLLAVFDVGDDSGAFALLRFDIGFAGVVYWASFAALLSVRPQCAQDGAAAFAGSRAAFTIVEEAAGACFQCLRQRIKDYDER